MLAINYTEKQTLSLTSRISGGVRTAFLAADCAEAYKDGRLLADLAEHLGLAVLCDVGTRHLEFAVSSGSFGVNNSLQRNLKRSQLIWNMKHNEAEINSVRIRRLRDCSQKTSRPYGGQGFCVYRGRAFELKSMAMVTPKLCDVNHLVLFH